MEPSAQHAYAPAVSFDGGDLDCGNGLLLLIRKHIDPLERGQLLEIQSTETSVEADLPAWCRMTGNQLVSWTKAGKRRSFLVSKGAFAGSADHADQPPQAEPEPETPEAARARAAIPIVAVTIPRTLPAPVAAPPIRPLSVMGIGSWPRPRWMLQALHDHMEGRLDEAAFQSSADDAVQLAVAAQQRAGVDVVTDGEQRRDSYASFVGGRLDNCQLIPLTDLLPYVDDPEAFEQELRALDVPAGEVRHPAVFGPLGRSRPLAAHELDYVRGLTAQPVKVALPGPYLLTRTMWMECVSDRAYASREALAADVVRVLREELAALLAQGAALVQFDEPVLSEVAFSGTTSQRSFMCGALSEKRDPVTELAFARDLLNAVVDGFPQERVAMHMCRGNWTTDESKAMAGDYRPLVETLAALNVGTLFLELYTPRAGEMAVLQRLPERQRIGVGLCNQKHAHVESLEEVLRKGEEAIRLFGAGRVLFNPDCGFATFADAPVSSARIAEAKLRTLAEAAAILRQRYGV
ncbi:5-methyltetrahydropteroyltriglutamate--homocysteine methyltransferase [Paraburkholderia acidisoli]|uniref:5-methyltetrahydropteroyltriglutamate--homocysteine methyltransferase n=1 Tax=Paraburkholderia acidisoli TaxID=2571748 RepID=A0A7Z2GMN8_9BURK|nr:5-methyltetrahydropteroyltriglutamate--homocysteine methyltransferase [Paraburkholderia acidisoli]QGZ64623.1 5-methyltetrahydropteroyltriglutamate--homocysteine methyltransferase [Paraburkholderia acidisoli]